MVQSRLAHASRWQSILQHRVLTHPLGEVLVAALAGTLLCVPIAAPVAYAQSAEQAPAQNQRQQTVVLGVVRSPDNTPDWQQITARLQATGITYRVIDLQQVRQLSDLSGLSVLFLPNVKTITSAQMIVLESWMNQGGRMIATGPIGELSFHGVRQAMRSLLGAYWDTSLPQLATLSPVEGEDEAWLQRGEQTTPVEGGVIKPSGASSETVMTWQTAPVTDAESSEATSDDPEENSADADQPNATPSDPTAAIVTTPQTTFLGWEWGTDDSSQPFDQAWLQAAVDRFHDAPPIAIAPPQAQPSALATGRRTSPTLQPSTPRSVGAPSSRDPAEQVAPAGLEVQRGALPITTLEAIAMRQELENLIGRFESALLSANSLNADPNLAAVSSTEKQSPDRSNPILTASASDRIPARSNRSNPPTGDTLSQARRILDEFPQLVARRDYATARQEWLQARQLLWDNFPTDRPIAQPEIRAMWLDRGTIVAARSRQGLAEIFDRLADAGINTVFFETVNAGYPIYPSDVAPQQNPLILGWDPLKDAVELAHERDMELHAWVWTFAAGNRAHNRVVNLPPDYLGPVLTAHPDWANYDNRGNIIPIGQGKPFLDPANPAVRSYLLRLFQEIVTRYDVDGLQLDYIRYPFQDPSAGRTYGYGLAARQQFQQLTGVDPLQISPGDRALWQQWTDFRTQQVNSFVADVSRMVRRRDPDLILSTAVFAMSEHERIQKIQQDWQAWAQQGIIDLVVPMSYAMDTNRLQRLAGPWLTESADLDGVLVLPSIRLLNLPNAAAIDQIQALRDMPAGGYSLFAVADLNDTLHSIFHRTQGSDRTDDPIPYRQPFEAAAARYTALQREWSYMLSNGQLWMREREREDWQTQVEELGDAFATLADDPSESNLRQARQRLERFQQRFDSWMNLQSLDQDYRVHTWKNRLATLETLLNYGERVVIGRSGT